MSFFTDYGKALKLAREARKSGDSIALTTTLPVIRLGCGFLNTVEGCTVYNHCPREVQSAVRDVFNGFDEETKHTLIFAPKRGEYAARVRFWRDALAGKLPEADRWLVLSVIIKWFRHCIRIEIDEQRTFAAV